MALNPWQVFWKSLDEARLVVRSMLLAIFVAVVVYVWYVTQYLFRLIEAALMQGEGADWSNLAVILGAVTTFAGVTIPVLVSMFKTVWEDYRQSGTDWKAICQASDGAPHLTGAE